MLLNMLKLHYTLLLAFDKGSSAWYLKRDCTLRPIVTGLKEDEITRPVAQRYLSLYIPSHIVRKASESCQERKELLIMEVLKIEDEENQIAYAVV